MVPDGMGGGNKLLGNLLFNQVRESSDAGPFNSWCDRPVLRKLLLDGLLLLP